MALVEVWLKNEAFICRDKYFISFAPQYIYIIANSSDLVRW